MTRKQIEARETAETLIEDRGAANARAWAEHCMVRDPVGGFWRAVLDELTRLDGDSDLTVTP